MSDTVRLYHPTATSGRDFTGARAETMRRQGWTDQPPAPDTTDTVTDDGDFAAPASPPFSTTTTPSHSTESPED